MPAVTVEKKALQYLKTFETDGRVVKRVVIEGKRIELEFETEPEVISEFDKVDMRHGKTGTS
ncbi:hypothetical protein [Phaeobacter sp. B1627]|uniref:hypothetical protein n=1 Tax=Phaeobacter sp. B1627 TaxID=2583809 RepID=UPI00111A74D8|nr:hypothetical protein [Phaeobacter sp. B1627]TNJ48090.1 hypothetical protein FGE21_02160 [Phaeobacter sp. B1627]